MKTTGKKNFRLVAAVSVAIFSLLAVIGGSYSWFTIQVQTSINPSSFTVVNVGTCDLYSIELYKFNYTQHQFGTEVVTDYSAPETGTVDEYTFDKTRNQFGYLDESSNWHSVSLMNTYDPVSLTLTGGDVSSLNCNSIYKFTISTNNMSDVRLNCVVQKILDRVKQEDEIFLSTCADFDLFFESDLLDSNPAYTSGDDHKMYYPDYIDKSETLSANKELYYKLSYLSSLKSSHANLYNTNENTLISEKSLSFTYDSESGLSFITLYVNVNYAPSQLEDTMYRIYQSSIRAVCDFGFYFYFEQPED